MALYRTSGGASAPTAKEYTTQYIRQAINIELEEGDFLFPFSIASNAAITINGVSPELSTNTIAGLQCISIHGTSPDNHSAWQCTNAGTYVVSAGRLGEYATIGYPVQS